MCRRFEVTRAGFYAWRSRPPSPRATSDAAMTERVLEVFREARGLYGSDCWGFRSVAAGSSA